jgi:hypothetical protein
MALSDYCQYYQVEKVENTIRMYINWKDILLATFVAQVDLYADDTNCGMFCTQTKGKLLDFYKERAQQFYDGHVEEVNFSVIGDLVRRRTNLLIKRQTHGRVPEYLRGSNILLRPPLAIFSANIFQVRTLVGTGGIELLL